MTSSVIDPDNLWKISASADEGGATIPGGVQMAITTGSLDTPHDFCKGRAAAKDELKEIAEDPDDEEDEDGISADQEDNVFIAAGKALRFSGQWLTDNSVPDKIADYNENKQTPYEYVQDGLSNLSRTAISSMSSYERKEILLNKIKLLIILEILLQCICKILLKVGKPGKKVHQMI